MSADSAGEKPAAVPKAAPISESLKADELADAKRRAGEAEERLAAAHARECPSCGAVFQGGEGKMAKKKAAKKGASKDGEAEAAPASPESEAGAVAPAAAGAAAAPAVGATPGDGSGGGEKKDDGWFM